MQEDLSIFKLQIIECLSFKDSVLRGPGEIRKVSTPFRSLLIKRHWRLATPALLVLFSQKSTYKDLSEDPPVLFRGIFLDPHLSKKTDIKDF